MGSFLRRSSDPNMYFTCVCLIKDGVPDLMKKNEETSEINNQDSDGNEDENREIHRNYAQASIMVERSKAFHDLVESEHKKADNNECSHKRQKIKKHINDDGNDSSEDSNVPNMRILKLTKMKWLSENRNGYPDSSTPSPSISSTSTSSWNSDSEPMQRPSLGEKCLSTILELDKEHNMFGLSHTVVDVVSKRPRSAKTHNERPAFFQTAIVQVCCTSRCGGGCCRHKSNTDLPQSLKCAPAPCGPSPLGCMGPCGGPCGRAPPRCALKPRTPTIHVTCLPSDYAGSKPSDNMLPKKASNGKKNDAQAPPPLQPDPVPDDPNILHCELVCKASEPKCTCGLPGDDFSEPDCCFGMRVKIENPKTELKPLPVVLTPRCSSILQKPQMCRPCPHCPPCIRSPCCDPFLMPCYLNCRKAAPCLDPSNCFHNPPCYPPRRRMAQSKMICPKSCQNYRDKHGKEGCPNILCLGKNEQFVKAIAQWGR